MQLAFALRFAVLSILGGLCLAAAGSWLDAKPYTVERVALNIAVFAGMMAVVIALPLAVKRRR